ncbi:hypothetical protein N0V83_000886 [Neocucurbitaria cava]|uniref:Uncharacterized protein n=1 Tax=Neocucurbitaria cava TaxID=798079 RepID=A0A9W8YIN5_9PLEO|nr:hypothetical protein N0V83_000886 [Neocucurbitaria cava]
MSLFKSESRKTAIIEDAVGLEQSLIQQAQSQKKGKRQSKQKTTGGFRFSAPQDAGISKQTPAPKAKATPTTAPGKTTAQSKQKTTGGLRFAAPQDAGISKPTPAPKAKAKAKATPTTAPEKTTAKRKLDSASIPTMPPQTTSKMRKLNPIDAPKPTKYSANQASIIPKEQVQDRRVQSQAPQPEIAHHTEAKATPTMAPGKATAKRKLDSVSGPTMPPQTTSKMRKLNPIDSQKPSKYSTNQNPSMMKEQIQDRRIQPQVPASEVAHDTKSGQGGTSQGDEHRSANHHTQTVPKATSPQHPQFEHPKLRYLSKKQSETRALNAKSNLKISQTVERVTDTPTSHKGYEGGRPGHTSAPYLKNGRHGNGGDFDDDPARETGEGHQYEPEDMKRYEGFLQLRHRFYRMHRTYPNLHERERVDPRFKAAWDTEQMWYNRFTEKYPGARVDQWPCGCQKLSEGDESESESEEE